MTVLTRHWELKLLAVGFSIALWLFVMTSEKSDIVFSAPIEYDGMPPGLVLTGERPDSVDVQVHGLRGTLARLSADQIKARVSLSGARPGEITLRLLPEQIIVPAGVTVVRINPSRVRLVLAAAAPSGSEPSPRRPRS